MKLKITDDGESGSSSSYVSSETNPELDDQAQVDDHDPSAEAVKKRYTFGFYIV